MVSTELALGVTIGTLVAFMVIGIWFSRGRVNSVEDLISARNSTNEGRTTATLIASVMGVWILLAAPEAGAVFGIAAVFGYGLGEALPMLAYMKIGPRLRKIMPNGHSLTEYVYVRYGRGMYGFVIFVSIFYMFMFVAAELTGIALALSLIAEVPQWQTAVLVGSFVLLYTGYGGLRASILTDAIQALIVLPLLVVAFAGIIITLGGTSIVYNGITSTDPTLLDPTASAGLKFGFALALAIVGAELINQMWWQRIYAADSTRSIARGFRNATIANGMIVVLAALFGIVAVGNTAIDNPSVAFFSLLGTAFPEWILLAVVLLALLLVMSSVDTLFNALSSLITVDLARLVRTPSNQFLSRGARLLTFLIAVAAVVVSLRARSVLELFLFADLLGAAVAFPLVYGLFSGELTGPGAVASSIGGLLVGSAYFPFPLGIDATLRSFPVLESVLPATDSLYLTAFAGAVSVSIGLSLLATRLSPGQFEFDRLTSDVHRLDESVQGGGTVPRDEGDA